MQVWDMATHIRSMFGGVPNGSGPCTTVHQAPLQIFTGRKDDGFAFDWNLLTTGCFLSGYYPVSFNSMNSQHIALSIDNSNSLLNSSLINS